MKALQRFLLVLAIITAPVLLLEKCSKDEFDSGVGYVENTGSFSSGGCGWIIVLLNGVSYQPNNLPTSFQVDGEAIKLRYKVISKETDCPGPNTHSGKIHIIKIEAI